MKHSSSSSRASASSALSRGGNKGQLIRPAVIIVLAFLAFAALRAFRNINAPNAPAKTAASSAQDRDAQVLEIYGQLPLSFEASRGPADEEVDFVARGAGYTVSLSPTTAVLRLRKSECGSQNEEIVTSGNSKSETRNPKSPGPQSAIRDQQSRVLQRCE